MYQSFGEIKGRTSDTLLRFCSVVNRHGQAFQPPILAEMVARSAEHKGQASLRYSRHMEMLLAKSYEKALDRHASENPNGPPPKRITYMYFGRKRYTLQWRTSGGTTITLSVNRQRERPCFAIVKGPILNSVWKYANLLSLPQPMLIPERRLGDVMMPLGEILDLLQWRI